METIMLYRIATYAMPDAARDEFLAQSRIARDLVRVQPGYLGDQWLEKVAGPGTVNIITIAKWRDADSIAAAG
jgi:heme-degrading monooxygenase HmoA